MSLINLRKKYAAAYKKFLCPVCQYPIRPCALKFSFLAQLKSKSTLPADMNYLNMIEVYFCPSCGSQLFEKCESCEHTRHSYLQFCEYCGKEKESKS